MKNDMQEKKSVMDEKFYRTLISGISDYAIYMIDPGGHVSSWNAGAKRFKGYVAEEILGEHFSRFYTSEDRAANLPETALQRARWRKASTKRKAGASARTVRVSGPTSSSIRSTTTPAPWSAMPR
jgi:PAS domain S-box-containing protein